MIRISAERPGHSPHRIAAQLFQPFLILQDLLKQLCVRNLGQIGMIHRMHRYLMILVQPRHIFRPDPFLLSQPSAV